MGLKLLVTLSIANGEYLLIDKTAIQFHRLNSNSIVVKTVYIKGLEIIRKNVKKIQIKTQAFNKSMNANHCHAFFLENRERLGPKTLYI